MNWLGHWLGLDNPAGPVYAWWSGAGSDLPQLAIFGALVGLYRKHQCEVRRCWRLGRHRTAAAHCVCHRHSPTGAPTHTDVLAAHAEALGEQPPAN